jgi:ribosomal protein L11 methyltransferase
MIRRESDENKMLVWRKLTSAKWEDAWLERLCFLGPARIAVFGLPGGKTIRIEAYALTKKESAALVKQFGGQLRTLKDRVFTHQEPASREPIRIRKKLLVIASEKQREAVARKFPKRKILVIPAAMAFGTGDHATTAACLRFLCDLAAEQTAVAWDMLDLGTGSGILGIAARLLGARNVTAFDFDPHAVRTAKENARLNKVTGMDIRKRDVTQWTPERTRDVVTANLFSEVLIRAASRIAAATKPCGWLIFSGVMRHQEKECVAALKTHGFREARTVRKGKWVTIRAAKCA